jgi:hypothetical protein
MVCFTKLEVFRVVIAKIERGKGKVIIAVIKNLLCNAVKIPRSPEEMNTTLEKMIKLYIIKEHTIRLPIFKFAEAQLTMRPLHDRYMANHEVFCKRIGEGIEAMAGRRMSKIYFQVSMS